MNSKMLNYAVFMLVGTFISSIAQVLLKKESEQPHDSIIKEYLNPRVIIAYGLFFSSTLLCIISYKLVPLSMGAVLESSGYIFVTAFGVICFKEKLSWLKILALMLIISGIITSAFFG